MSEIDGFKAKAPQAAVPEKSQKAAGAPAAAAAAAKKAFVCPHCNAKFEKAMKFCGECGKAMEA
jgi:membrane protease subunit (stomatin/prohibitin family)